MKLVSSLLPFVLLSVSLSASARVLERGSLATVPLTRKMDTNCLKNLIECEAHRVKSLIEGDIGDIESIFAPHTVKEGVTNSGVGYTATIGIGNPPTNYEVIVDTGSSNLWVGAQKAYVVTSTSVKTGDNLDVTYGSGSVSGPEYLDQVTITQGLVITNQSLGAAADAQGISVDGIMGIGPVDLTVGTLTPSKDASVPTVVDNAYSNGLIGGHEIGVYFQPYDQQNAQTGELSWGGANQKKYTGDLTYAPVTSTRPAGYYWGVDSAITYGSTTLLNSAGIIDTGTTLVQIASDAFQAYKDATGAVADQDTGLLSITQEQYSNLKPLNFVINGQTFAMSPNAQIWPRALNTAIGGASDSLYLVIADMGSPSGSGLDFIAGYGFLERFYTVYDSEQSRVGFAETAYTDAESN